MIQTITLPHNNFIISKYLRSIKRKPSNLYFVPEEYRTNEICSLAVSMEGYLIYLCPIQTPNLCKIAVANSGRALKHIHPSKKTEDVCTIAVNTHGEALQYVPSHLHTKELYLDAVRNNGFALKYVKEQDVEICQEAYDSDPRAFKFIKKKFRPYIDKDDEY